MYIYIEGELNMEAYYFIRYKGSQLVDVLSEIQIRVGSVTTKPPNNQGNSNTGGEGDNQTSQPQSG